MKHLILSIILLFSSLAIADEDKAIISRGEDKLAKIFVNVGGTTTESASFGDPANCATSGALICSGTYTAIVSNVSGGAANSLGLTKFIRVGAMVHVFGRATFDQSSSTSISFLMTLPIASNLTGVEDLAGIGSPSRTDADGYTVMFIDGNIATDKASFATDVPSSLSRQFSFNFSYEIK